MLFSIILNISVSLAVYALMMIYHAFAEELAPHRPLAQFLSIKGVVFFAFWQGIVLEALAYFGVIHDQQLYKVEEIEYELQNILVTIEMAFIFSLVHVYAFTHEPYVKQAKVKKSE